jgi:hypothetical protein
MAYVMHVFLCILALTVLRAVTSGGARQCCWESEVSEVAAPVRRGGAGSDAS